MRSPSFNQEVDVFDNSMIIDKESEISTKFLIAKSQIDSYSKYISSNFGLFIDCLLELNTNLDQLRALFK